MVPANIHLKLKKNPKAEEIYTKIVKSSGKMLFLLRKTAAEKVKKKFTVTSEAFGP